MAKISISLLIREYMYSDHKVKFGEYINDKYLFKDEKLKKLNDDFDAFLYVKEKYSKDEEI